MRWCPRPVTEAWSPRLRGHDHWMREHVVDDGAPSKHDQLLIDSSLTRREGVCTPMTRMRVTTRCSLACLDIARAADYDTELQGMPGLHPSHPWIKVDKAPIYILEYPTGHEKNYFDDLASMYAEFLAWLNDKPTRHVTIADLRRLNSTARGRQMATEFYAATKAFEGTHLLGRGYLTLDERNRHVITAVTWGTKMEIPKMFFASEAPAIAWAQTLFEAG